jgi:type I restriction enzyme, S subunit
MVIRSGFKQTDVGVIPKEWDTFALGELLYSMQLGGNYRNSERRSNWPLIKMGNLGRSKIKLDKLEFIDLSHLPNPKDRLYEDDVLFNTRNTLELVGKVAIWRNELNEAYFNSNIMRMSFNESCVSSSRFMNYILNTPSSISKLYSIATGTTSVAAIYSRDLIKLRIPLPSKAEQKSIAGALSDADTYIESLDHLIAKKRRIKQGVMQELLTGKRRLPGFQIKSGFKETTIGPIPTDWDVKPLQNIVEFANGKPHEGDVTIDGQFWLITLDSIGIDGNLKSVHKRTNAPDSLLHKNDIVAVLSDLAHGHLLGLCDLIPQNDTYVLNQRMGRLRITTSASPHFIRLQINRFQEHFRKRGQGTSQKHIYRRDFDKLEIPFPLPREQEAIGRIISDIEMEIHTIQQKFNVAKQIKQGMMQELLTGRIRLV